MTMNRACLMAASISVLVFACSSAPPGGEEPANPDQGPLPGTMPSPGLGGGGPGAGAEATPENSCGAEEITGTTVPSNVLIVLDRSCSMNKPAGGGKTKWQVAVAAVKDLVAANEGKIRFGLELFPDTDANACRQGAPQIPVAEGNETKIDEMLTKALAPNDPLHPGEPCVTNIDTAMLSAGADPALADTSRGNYVLLVSDGKQAKCNESEGDAAVMRILGDLFANKVPMFVVGFGAETDAAQMNAYATAGGVPRGDATKFYNATDAASLQSALASISKKTLSCEFTLTKTPADPKKVFAFFDDETKVDAFAYDAATNKVTFSGAACDSLRLGRVDDVDIVFGCPEATPR